MESLHNCADITHTRYTHKETAASLIILQKQACRKYVKSVQKGEADSISTWRSKKETTILIQFILIEGDSGAIDLAENPSVLLRWMVSGPGLARLVPDRLKIVMKTSTRMLPPS